MQAPASSHPPAARAGTDPARCRARGHPGQDPYHGRGQAEGLAFSVAPGVRLPPSLQNIFKEMQRDLGVPFPPFPNPGGSLVKWAQNGVLLLNTCLTVEEGQAASHAGKGWELLTDAVIRHVAEGDRPVVSCCGARTHSPNAPSSRRAGGTSCSPPTTLTSVGLAAARALHWQWPFRQARAFRERNQAEALPHAFTALEGMAYSSALGAGRGRRRPAAAARPSPLR